ncbi:MAG: DUF5317 domain-containing protein [Actinomycetota bacterium]
MLLIAGAIVLGVVVGLALGGNIRNLARLRFLWWPLAVVGLVLQLIPIPSIQGELDRWVAVLLLIASYVVLLAFVTVNLRLPGFPVIAVAFAVNVLVIAVNGGMPVRDSALRQAYGPAYSETRRELLERGGAKHHLERPDDDLMLLADVIPIGPPVRQVFSVGDLLFMGGVVWVLAATTARGGSGRRAAKRESPAGRAETASDASRHQANRP